MALIDFAAEADRCSQCSGLQVDPVRPDEELAVREELPERLATSTSTAYSARGRYARHARRSSQGESEITEAVEEVAFTCLACGACDVACKVCRYNLEPARDGPRAQVPRRRERPRAPGAPRRASTPSSETGNPFGLPARRPRRLGGRARRPAPPRREGAGPLLRRLHVQLRRRAPGGRPPVGPASSGRPASTSGSSAAARCAAAAAGTAPGTATSSSGWPRRTSRPGSRAGVEEIVTSCSDCFHAIAPALPAARARRSRSPTPSNWSARLAAEGKLAAGRTEVPMTVTWHDPCHLGRQGEPYVPWAGRGEEDPRPGHRPTTRRSPATTARRGSTTSRATCSARSRAWSSSRWSGSASTAGAAAPAAACREAYPGVLALDRRRADRGGEGDRRRGPRHRLRLVRAELPRRDQRERRADRRAGHPRARRARAALDRAATDGAAPAGGRDPMSVFDRRPRRAPRHRRQAQLSARDPAVLDTYRYSLAHTAIHLGPFFDAFTPRGAAVVLPGLDGRGPGDRPALQPVQVKYKASSTFWSAQGYPSEDDTRPARHAPDGPDPRHRRAEPVRRRRAGRHRRHAPGRDDEGGPQHPHPGRRLQRLDPRRRHLVLRLRAVATCTAGFHFDNLMAIEWVEPDRRDLLRTGSAGAGLGWFCGEGPGPSMRGVARGFLGSKGAMGVFTKCSIKLFPWPGPATLPVDGHRPGLPRRPRPTPSARYTLAFPDWQAWADAAQLIWETGHRLHRPPPVQHVRPGPQVRDGPDPHRPRRARSRTCRALLEDPEVQAATADMKRDFQIIMAGQTMRDMEWQEAVLDEILARTGGWKVEAMLDPAIHDWSLLYLIRLGHKNLNLVFGGSLRRRLRPPRADRLRGPARRGGRGLQARVGEEGRDRRRRRRLHHGPDRRPGRRRHRPLGELHLLRLARQRVHRGHARVLPGCTALRRRARLGRSAWRTWNAAARGVGRLRDAEGGARRDAPRRAAAGRLPLPGPDLREALNPNDLGDQYYETGSDDTRGVSARAAGTPRRLADQTGVAMETTAAVVRRLPGFEDEKVSSPSRAPTR